jgi:serine protease Do
MNYLRLFGLFLAFLVGFKALASELPDLVQKVGPAVLSIHTRILNKKDSYSTALGTGFVVLNEGVLKNQSQKSSFLVLTNQHVIEDAVSVEVITTADKRYNANIVGVDKRNDIAVLRVEMPNQTPVLKLKNSKSLKVGEPLFAIGNPHGLSHTVTNGILSAKDRSLGVGAIDRYLQTNVAINFGNSGGPLFDYSGEVVGITTLAKTDSQGLGFAIPSDTVLRLLPRLSSGQNQPRAWLGLNVVPAQTALLEHFQKTQWNSDSKVAGVVVTGVVQQSPASGIGLKKGDLILGYFKESKEYLFNSPYELRDIVDSAKPGEKIELKVQRQGNQFFKATIQFAAAPEESKYYEFD